MNSYPNHFVPKAITDTGEDIKIWFCSRRLADLIIRKGNSCEWHRAYLNIELRRLCCVDDTPKNAESFFIGKSLRLLKKIWGSGIVVSYADKEHGHTGIIYKASNFKMVGEIPGADVIIYNGKQYHDKTIRTKYNGDLKWYSKKIKSALESGEAYYKKTSGKFTYVYNL